METPDPIGKIKLVALVIVVYHVLHFVVVVINSSIAVIQLHLIHVVTHNVGIRFRGVENIVVHGVGSVFVSFNFTQNDPFS